MVIVPRKTGNGAVGPEKIFKKFQFAPMISPI